MKRFTLIAILLISAMLFVSCVTQNEISPETEVTVETNIINETDKLENSEYVMSNIEMIDCEGHEFNFSTRRESNPEWDIWALRDIDAEVANGERSMMLYLTVTFILKKNSTVL